MQLQRVQIQKPQAQRLVRIAGIILLIVGYTQQANAKPQFTFCFFEDLKNKVYYISNVFERDDATRGTFDLGNDFDAFLRARGYHFDPNEFAVCADYDDRDKAQKLHDGFIRDETETMQLKVVNTGSWPGH